MLDIETLLGAELAPVGPRHLQLALVDTDPHPDEATLQALSAAAQHALEVAAFVGDDRFEFRAWELSARRVDDLDAVGPRRVALAVRFRHRLVASSTVAIEACGGLNVR